VVDREILRYLVAGVQYTTEPLAVMGKDASGWLTPSNYSITSYCTLHKGGFFFSKDFLSIVYETNFKAFQFNKLEAWGV